MKKLLYIFLLTAISLSLSAQEEVRLDYLHLHGGSFLKGHIQDTLDGAILQFRLADNSIMMVPIALVKKRRKADEKQWLYQDGRTAISDGVYSRMSFQFLTGSGGSPSFYGYGGGDYRVEPSFSFSMGMYVKKWLAVGAGTGLDFYLDRRMIPVFLESRIHLGKRSNSPFFGAELGYSFLMDKREFADDFAGTVVERAGFFAYPSVGMRFAGKGDIDFMVDVGYKFQPYRFHVQYPEDWWTLEERITSSYNSLVLRFAWVF
ncbi:MAG: hypothetical protein KTR30_23705 [Saprospiraceae bacterium]|nr:hypothetical protein [Saprospiraceae bacterium]